MAEISSSNDFQLTDELEKVKDEFDLNTFTEQWMEECEKNNGSEAVESIDKARETLFECFSSKINFAQISEEMTLAAPKGELDEVFIHYCNLLPDLKACREPMTQSLQVCLSDQGVEDLERFNAAIDGALDFMCYKGGERIAIFMAENGTQCLGSNVDMLTRCMNNTVPDIISAFKAMQNSNASVFDENNCRIEAKLKSCVVDVLKTCSDPTPANIIEGLMDSMYKATPCYVHSSASPTPYYVQSTFIGWLCSALLVFWFSIQNRHSC